MTNMSVPADLSAGLPQDIIAVMRAEVPGLTEEIIAALREEFPEYARPMDGPYGHALQLGVRQALSSFVDMVADPSAPHDQRDEVFRTLGRYEAHEGRSLDTLQAAFRVGARLAWQRACKVGQQAELSPSLISQLADSVFGYMHELATLAVAGYHEARARSGQERDHRRRRLLALLTEVPPAPRRAITDLAALAEWAVPDEVTPVAVQAHPGTAGSALPGPGLDENGTGPQPTGSLLPMRGDVLADMTGAHPCLLFPGPLTEARGLALEKFLNGRRAAVGLTVRLESAGEALGWARQTLALAQAGVINGGQITQCEDQLVNLLLLSDTALADQIVARQLACLAGLPEQQRGPLTETFSALLAAGGKAVDAADRLHLHPQTVRYRRRLLAKMVGGQLDDPDARFEMELALRVSRLRQAQRHQDDSTPPAPGTP